MHIKTDSDLYTAFCNRNGYSSIEKSSETMDFLKICLNRLVSREKFCHHISWFLLIVCIILGAFDYCRANSKGGLVLVLTGIGFYLLFRWASGRVRLAIEAKRLDISSIEAHQTAFLRLKFAFRDQFPSLPPEAVDHMSLVELMEVSEGRLRHFAQTLRNDRATGTPLASTEDGFKRFYDICFELGIAREDEMHYRCLE